MGRYAVLTFACFWSCGSEQYLLILMTSEAYITYFEIVRQLNNIPYTL